VAGRTEIVLKRTTGEERTYRILGALPSEIRVSTVAASQFNDPQLDAFGDKTYARVGDTLVYQEVV